jgi:hypothetical protein
MKLRYIPVRFPRFRFVAALAIFCATVLAADQSTLLAQTPPASESQVVTTPTPQPDAPTISNDQLDALVAPIALYSDQMLAMTLAASTYPLEVVQLQQWMERNKNLKDKALAAAVAKEPWDSSVQSLAVYPELVTRLAGNIQWTANLGNAFLAQQTDVMDAVQRMRGKAQSKGTLKTSDEQKVSTKTTSGGKQVIVVEQAKPEVVYIPSYDPEVVYGPSPYYPYYPYSYPGYYPGMGLAWGAGIIIGAGIIGGWWGDCDWNGGDININRNNNFNRNNINRGQGGNRWQHRPEHRGNAPYGDRRTADKFGGRGPGNNRPGGGNRPSTLPSNRPGGGNRPSTLPSNRPGGGNVNRPSTKPGGGNRPTTKPAGGSKRSSNSIGNRKTSPSGNYGSRGGSNKSRANTSRPSSSRGSYGGGSFGGGSSRNVRASSSRGSGSMGGGGFSRGSSGGFSGGSRGGGSRGGGSRGGGRRR